MSIAIRFHRTGGPDVLQADELDPGAPGDGQLLIRHQAIGLNYIDTYHRSGLYPLPLPSGLGLEAAGVVEAAGPGVSDFAPGDSIAYAWGPPGAYAERRLIPAARVVKLPADISPQTAAAALLKGCTAEFLVRRCYPAKAGDWALVHAAAGGVGLILGQWLKAIGVTAIGVVSTPAKAELARANGYAHVLLTSDAAAARVRELTGGRGVDVVYDGVGKDSWEASLDSLKRRGMLVSFGNASGPVTGVDIGVLAAKGGLFLTRPSLFNYYVEPAEIAEGTAAVFAMIRSGAIQIRAERVYPLAQAAQAHKDLEARKTTGSSLLIP